MIAAFLILLGFQLLGEALRLLLHLPVPGAVAGMLVLTVALAWRGDGAETAGPSSLDHAAGTLLRSMGLLFVPAGVGLMTQTDLLRREWAPMLGGMAGSTVLALAVTALVMRGLSRTAGTRSDIPALPEAEVRR